MQANRPLRPAGRRLAARLGRTLFWEFVQNLLLVAGLVAGLALWRQGRYLPAAGCILAGGTVGALLIRYTESRITGGKREAWAVTVTNLAGTTLLMAALALYLSAPGSLGLDALVGGGMGLFLGVAQSLAARQRVDIRHALALAVACAAALPALRLVTATLPIAASIALIAAAVTLIIAAVDYTPVIAGPASE